jgi:hypothetical protein
MAGLASVDPYLPMQPRDRLLPQTEIKSNLLRTSRLHPQLSAAAHFHGQIDYNNTASSSPGCKIIAHEKPPQRRTWTRHGQPGYSLGPAMHHYICQNVNTTSTASDCIVDTLQFPPQNLPMPPDRLIMAANDMADSLKYPHPDVPFNTVGDDTISALTTLSAIFKRKYNKIPAQHLIDSPIKAAENKRPTVLIQPVLTSPIKHTYKTRSQTQVNTIPAHVSESQDLPQLPRVATPSTRIAAPPRVPARAPPPPETCPNAISGTWAAPKTPYLWATTIEKTPMMNAVLHPASGKEMQYTYIMQHPKLGPKYKTGFGNELGLLCQVIRDIQGTNTCFFVELSNIPKDRKITYGKLVCDHKPNKAEK